MGLSRGLRNARGVTLIEILMAGLLLSVVFLACASAYISTLKFFNSIREKSGQLYAFMGMEHVSRRAELANDAIVNDGGATNAETGKHLKLRWDYALDGTPNATASDVTDDTWVKYGIVEEPAASGTWRLFWRPDPAASGPAGDVSAADAQVESGLVLTAASQFNLTSPSGTGQGLNTTLRITLESTVGEPPETLTLNSDVLIGSKAKS